MRDRHQIHNRTNPQLGDDLQKAIREAQREANALDATVEPNIIDLHKSRPRTSGIAPRTPTTESIRKSNPLDFTRADTSHLTGFQRVAQSVGLDINTPGIEGMSIDQMKEVAYQQTLAKSVNPIRKARGLDVHEDTGRSLEKAFPNPISRI